MRSIARYSELIDYPYGLAFADFFIHPCTWNYSCLTIYVQGVFGNATFGQLYAYNSVSAYSP